jgi:hypothetical protein
VSHYLPNRCPHCDEVSDVPAKAVGRRVRCPWYRQTFRASRPTRPRHWHGFNSPLERAFLAVGLAVALAVGLCLLLGRDGVPEQLRFVTDMLGLR